MTGRELLPILKLFISIISYYKYHYLKKLQLKNNSNVEAFEAPQEQELLIKLNSEDLSQNIHTPTTMIIGEKDAYSESLIV